MGTPWALHGHSMGYFGRDIPWAPHGLPRPTSHGDITANIPWASHGLWWTSHIGILWVWASHGPMGISNGTSQPTSHWHPMGIPYRQPIPWAPHGSVGIPSHVGPDNWIVIGAIMGASPVGHRGHPMGWMPMGCLRDVYGMPMGCLWDVG